jgi:hypothetical protein
MQTESAVLDELERVFMHGEIKGKMADVYGKGLSNAHTCADALVNDADGGHHTDTVIYFAQVRSAVLKDLKDTLNCLVIGTELWWRAFRHSRI